jgi:hypothetical protein
MVAWMADHMVDWAGEDSWDDWMMGSR